MKLQDLFAGIDVDASLSKHARLEVTHVASDSRTVEPGSLFVALAGKQSDGAQFVNEAVDRGAVAVISEKPIGGAKAPVFQVRSARRALAKVAANFYGNPAKDLVLLGVTGTNGKTTVAWLVESICAAGMNPVGLFGTIAVRYGGRSYPVTHTTPDPLTLHRTLRAMVDDGIDTVVLEVSSHAMLQERLHGLHFRAAGFTNLSRDHLDYHPDLESYFQAKRKLFTENVLPGGLAVVNGDDTYTMRVYNEVRQQRCQAWRFSRFGNAELSAEKVESDARGIRGVLKTPAGDITFDSSLVGAHNLDNILCAAGIALAGGASRRDVQEGIGQVRSIRGRMEPVVGKGITAYVDYAHTDDALTKALEAGAGAHQREALCGLRLWRRARYRQASAHGRSGGGSGCRGRHLGQSARREPRADSGAHHHWPRKSRLASGEPGENPLGRARLRHGVGPLGSHSFGGLADGARGHPGRRRQRTRDRARDCW